MIRDVNLNVEKYNLVRFGIKKFIKFDVSEGAQKGDLIYVNEMNHGKPTGANVKLEVVNTENIGDRIVICSVELV